MIALKSKMDAAFKPCYIKYCIQLPGPEERDDIAGCLELHLAGDEKATVGRLKSAWPFEGEWHFRAQVATKEGHVYLDLPGDGSAIPRDSEGAAVVRALPLFDIGAANDGETPAPWAHPDAYYDAARRRVDAIPWDAGQFPIVYYSDDAMKQAGPRSPSAATAAPVAARSSATADSEGGPRTPVGAHASASGDSGSFWSSEHAGATISEEGGGDDAHQQHNRLGSEYHDDSPAHSASSQDGGFAPGDDDLRERSSGGDTGPHQRSGGSIMKGFFASAQRAVEKAAVRAAAVVDKAAAVAERAVEGVTSAAPAAGAGSGHHSSAGGSSSEAGGKKGGWLGLGSLAKSILGSGAHTHGGGPSAASTVIGEAASDEARVNLLALQVQYTSPFRPEFSPHEELLERLWAAASSSGAVAEGEFVRVGPQWAEVRACVCVCVSLSSYRPVEAVG